MWSDDETQGSAAPLLRSNDGHESSSSEGASHASDGHASTGVLLVILPAVLTLTALLLGLGASAHVNDDSFQALSCPLGADVRNYTLAIESALASILGVMSLLTATAVTASGGSYHLGSPRSRQARMRRVPGICSSISTFFYANLTIACMWNLWLWRSGAVKSPTLSGCDVDTVACHSARLAAGLSGLALACSVAATVGWCHIRVPPSRYPSQQAYYTTGQRRVSSYDDGEDSTSTCTVSSCSVSPREHVAIAVPVVSDQQTSSRRRDG